MITTNREDNIAYLAEVLTKDQLANIISHNYSDQALAVMAEFDRGYVERFANTLYDTESMEKVIGAYCNKLIDWKDLLHIAEYSCYDFASEEYIDRFIRSIEAKEIDHTNAARILTASAYEHDTYSGLLELVKSGAYYPTKNASIGITVRVANELRDLGAPMTAMRKDGGYYDLTQKSEFDEAVKNGDRIKLVKYPKLAVTVRNMMMKPDWEDFKAWLAENVNSDRGNLTSTDLEKHYRSFSMERYAEKLSAKAAAEYETFIDEMKQRPSEQIIRSAYEIVVKEQIAKFMSEVPQIIPEEKTDVLMSCTNMLDELYDQWRFSNSMELEDMEGLVEETADKIIAARERERKLAAELAKKAQGDVISDKLRWGNAFKRKAR